MVSWVKQIGLAAAAIAGALVLSQCGQIAESQSRDTPRTTTVTAPRPIAAPAPLRADEQQIVTLFERAAPSVVQVVVIARSRSPPM